MDGVSEFVQPSIGPWLRGGEDSCNGFGLLIPTGRQGEHADDSFSDDGGLGAHGLWAEY